MVWVISLKWEVFQDHTKELKTIFHHSGLKMKSPNLSLGFDQEKVPDSSYTGINTTLFF